MVHEVQDQNSFFEELKSIIKPDGQIFIVEPPFHVSKQQFKKMIRTALNVGFSEHPGSKILFNKTIILKNS